MRMHSFISSAVACLSAAVALVSPISASGQGFPAHAVRIIVPFPAAGTQDALARTIGEPLSVLIKQPVVVENRTGAAGNIGTDALAKAAPDGYTLGILSGVQTANAAFYRRLPYDLERDFVPVRALGESDIVIVSSSKTPFATVPEFLAYARAHPGQVNFGSTTSLTMDLFKVLSGISVTMVPYKGPSDAMQDLITGRIDLSAGPLPQMLPLIREGKIRPLAIAGSRRASQLPDVPAVAETVPGYDAGMWYGLFVPTGTPADRMRRLEDALARVMASPDTVAKLRGLGIEPSGGQETPDELRARMRQETAQWRRVVEQTGNYAN